MTARAPGRPRRSASGPTPARIIAAAIRLLDTSGLERFTMRALATALGITPMAIYHHFGSREALLAAMAATIYAEPGDDGTGPPRARIEAMLLSYCNKVLAHPQMTLAIFADPSLYGGPAAALTEQLGVLLGELGLGPAAARCWRDILIDYTHGFGIAIAAQDPAVTSSASADYREALGALLEAVEAAAQ